MKIIPASKTPAIDQTQPGLVKVKVQPARSSTSKTGSARMTIALSRQQSAAETIEQQTGVTSKRKYDTISDEDRLKLILLIKDFGMSCHKASKVLNIAYNNAKVIFRIYKNEKRIRQTPK